MSLDNVMKALRGDDVLYLVGGVTHRHPTRAIVEHVRVAVEAHLTSSPLPRNMRENNQRMYRLITRGNARYLAIDVLPAIYPKSAVDHHTDEGITAYIPLVAALTHYRRLTSLVKGEMTDVREDDGNHYFIRLVRYEDMGQRSAGSSFTVGHWLRNDWVSGKEVAMQMEFPPVTIGGAEIGMSEQTLWNSHHGRVHIVEGVNHTPYLCRPTNPKQLPLQLESIELITAITEDSLTLDDRVVSMSSLYAELAMVYDPAKVKTITDVPCGIVELFLKKVRAE